MPGHREDARKLVQCMDLFVLSSFSEGASMAFLEAIAAGVPVAVTAVGGNPEVVIDGQTGLVVPSDCVQNLTNAILKWPPIHKKPDNLPILRVMFHERFTLEKMLYGYRRVYREMMVVKCAVLLGS